MAFYGAVFAGGRRRRQSRPATFRPARRPDVKLRVHLIPRYSSIRNPINANIIGYPHAGGTATNAGNTCAEPPDRCTSSGSMAYEFFFSAWLCLV